MNPNVIRVASLLLVLVASMLGQTKSGLYALLQNDRSRSSPDGLPLKCGLPFLAEASAEKANRAKRGIDVHQLFARPVAQTSVLVGSFRVHYDTTGIHEPALLDSFHNRIPHTAAQFAVEVGTTANYCVIFFHDSLGYERVPEDMGEGGGPEYDIYVQELGDLYGETVPETPINNKPDGGTFRTFMNIDNDFTFVSPPGNRGLPALRVTLAHELHHATQLGAYGYWTNDVYFHEITSVWMEDVLFTEVNDYYQYVNASFSHFRRPEISFANERTDNIMYSRGIWGHFVSKRYGPTMMRKCWEEIRSMRPLSAIDGALQQNNGTTLRQAFVEWTLWNQFTGARSDSVLYYPEGKAYPAMRTIAVDFSSSQRTYANTLQPLSARYHDIGGRATIPVANLNVNSAMTAPTTDHSYNLLLATSQIDDAYGYVAANIYAKIRAPDMSNWYIPHSSVSALPFPNPFIATGKTLVSFSVGAATNATLSILSTSMDLTYTSRLTPKLINGQNVIQWNGMNSDNRPAGSGVYIFVIQAGGNTAKGKFVLLRK